MWTSDRPIEDATLIFTAESQLNLTWNRAAANRSGDDLKGHEEKQEAALASTGSSGFSQDATLLQTGKSQLGPHCTAFQSSIIP